MAAGYYLAFRYGEPDSHDRFFRGWTGHHVILRCVIMMILLARNGAVDLEYLNLAVRHLMGDSIDWVDDGYHMWSPTLLNTLDDMRKEGKVSLVGDRIYLSNKEKCPDYIVDYYARYINMLALQSKESLRTSLSMGLYR